MKSIQEKVYLDLHKKVEIHFQKKIKTVLKYVQANPDCLNSDIQNYLKKIKGQGLHPLKFYLLEMLDDYLLINELTADKELDEVFDYWTDSEFSEQFMQKANKSGPLKASEYCLKLFLEHIHLYLNTHLLGKKVTKSEKYKLIKEIGDTREKGKLLTVGFQEIKSIELSGGYYQYLSLICHDSKNKAKFLKRISKALEIIRSYSPDSYKRFTYFTHTVVPIKEKRVVSYSSQKLPGYSTINLYQRDFVDLMDDLIHENGHHHLNAYLNFSELIFEDNDKIYYSPWRKALRPIRGIYHAVFTFFWGMELFKDLSAKLEADKINVFKLSAKEKDKIHFRFLEEYSMLEYSFQDLKIAYKQGKITELGKSLIDELEKSFKADEKLAMKTLAQLKKEKSKSYKDVIELKKHLKEMREHYKL